MGIGNWKWKWKWKWKWNMKYHPQSKRTWGLSSSHPSIPASPLGVLTAVLDSAPCVP